MNNVVKVAAYFYFLSVGHALVRSAEPTTAPATSQPASAKLPSLASIQFAAENGQMPEVQAHLEHLLQAWKAAHDRKAIQLLADACNLLTTRRFVSADSGGVAESFACRALLVAVEKIPIDARLQLASSMSANKLNQAIDPPDLPGQRRLKVEIWAQSLAALDEKIIPGFDCNSLPIIDAAPPGETSGLDPNWIKDPVRRARYQAVVDAADKFADLTGQQKTLREFQTIYGPAIRNRIALAYCPPGSDLSELKKILRDAKLPTQESVLIFDIIQRRESDIKKPTQK